MQDVITYNNENLPNRAPFGQDLLEWSQGLSLSPDDHEILTQKIRSATREELRRLRFEGKYDLLVSLGGSLAGYYAIAGFPALTVPAGYRKAGAPYGLTLMGEPFEDGCLLGAAFAFETAAQARIPPPGL